MFTRTTNHVSPSPPSMVSLARPAPPAGTHGLGSSIDMMGAAMSFARNTEIYGENEPAEFFYKVIGGTVRTYKVLNDGRRQIGGFYIAGDVFGLEAGEHHAMSAEAICDSKVLVIKRSALVNLAATNSHIARELWSLTSRELLRVQDHILLLIQTAQERVAGFLLEMAARAPAGNTIELPMSRQDIADYLGLTIETVSRTLSVLEHDLAIEVPSSRRIVLRNRSVLRALNG